MIGLSDGLHQVQFIYEGGGQVILTGFTMTVGVGEEG